jgi:hypothetical protein
MLNSQEKLLTVEEIFLDISKQILKSSYTLNLGQLLKIVRVKKVYLAKAKTRKNLKSKENNHRETS